MSFSDRHIGMPLIEIGYSERAMVYVVNEDAIKLMSKTNIDKMYAMLDTVRSECVEIKAEHMQRKKTKKAPVKPVKGNELLSCMSEYTFKQALILFKINIIYRYFHNQDQIGISTSIIRQFSKYAMKHGYMIPVGTSEGWDDIITPLQDYISEISNTYNLKWGNINEIFKKDYFGFMYNFCGRDAYRTATTVDCSLPTLMKFVNK